MTMVTKPEGEPRHHNYDIPPESQFMYFYLRMLRTVCRVLCGPHQLTVLNYTIVRLIFLMLLYTPYQTCCIVDIFAVHISFSDASYRTGSRCMMV